MKRTICIVSIIMLIAAMMVTPAAAATTRTVCAAGCEYTNIQTALDASSDGDTVFVYNGTYSGYFVMINKPNVTLKGEGADVVTYDGGSDNKIGMTAGEAAAPGCILEGFTITGAVAASDLVKPLAPDCIVRNCIFDGIAGDLQIQGSNTTFMNNVVLNLSGDCGIGIWGTNITFKDNVVLNATGLYGAMDVNGEYDTIVNNTIKGSTGLGISLDYDNGNNIITQNNIISNGDCGIEMYGAGDSNKIYLNNIIDNGVSVAYYDTPPAVTYWNSTEQIEYVYDSNTYTNYLGNNWGSDYGGADADGDGIGDTDYDIPGSATDKDFRPLMAGYENYLGKAAEDKPDLNVTVITTPASIIATQSNSIESTIANIGSADAGSFNVSLSADGTEIEEVNVTAGLGAGNSTEVTFAWTPSASGTYELCVVADCDGVIDESNETNNVTCMNVAVIVPPLTSITITPDTGITGQVSAYDIIVNTTGFKSLTVNIPAGFNAETPSDGEQIARVDLWWANEGAPHYGYVTFTANATDKMDVDAYIIGETSVTYRGMAVNYAEGATTSIKSPFGSHAERANLTLPTESANGSLTISGLPETITNVTVSIGAFVQNPTNVGDYTFTAKAEGEAVGKSAAVTISAPVVPGIVSYAPSAAAISDTEGVARTFNVTVNQTVNVSWLINGTVVKEGTEEGVTEASYTNTSAVLGTWNVSAVASNTNGTVMQTWIWTVEAPSPCFIATAAYGTTLHEDIDVLRDFRDERLMTNPLGRTFVKTYYETSPPIADALREHEGLRTAVRETLIKPLVYVSRMFVG